MALPTFSVFMREAAGRYVSLDGRFWRTMASLVARPGFLTLEYLRGRRRRYIRPSRLFLVLYLVLFGVVGLLQSPGGLSDEIVFVDSEQGKAELAKAKEEVAKARAEVARELAPKDKSPTVVISETEDDDMALVKSRDGSTFFGLDKDLNLTLRLGNKDLYMPPQVRKRWDHFKALPREAKAEQLYAGMLRYGPYAMVALLPAFALLMKIAYLGRGRRYPGRPQRYAEHLVYSAHLHAFAAVMLLALLLVPFGLVRMAIAGWIVFYAMRARHVVYRGRWWAGLLRALFIAIAYTVLLGFAVGALVIMAVMLR